MQPERLPPDDPREWLNRARSNLIQAEYIQPGIYLEDLCYQAQQAADKALKALLIHRGIRFPYTHDLRRLIELLEVAGEAIPTRIRDVDRLTRYAPQTRYPGLADPVSEEEYAEALGLAREAVRWAESRVRTGTGSEDA